MRLIVGLGNPGKEYKNTRHNVGFSAVEAIGHHFGCEDISSKDQFKARLAQGTIAGEKVLLAKPQTFMNLSGQAVQAIMSYYKIAPHDLIVIYDDFVIAPGKVRLRPSGSAGGHNGMESIITLLGTDQFIRIRIGIAPFNAWQKTDSNYVLGKLATQEKDLLDEVLKKMPTMIEVIIKEGIENAMQRFN